MRSCKDCKDCEIAKKFLEDKLMETDSAFDAMFDLNHFINNECDHAGEGCNYFEENNRKGK